LIIKNALDVNAVVFALPAHGTNEPDSIGRDVSSGCIRMRNESVVDLYDRATIGTKVLVLPRSVRA
jgi:lipoprotein-anchoring transpeptidase ErfK/SrfK